MAETLSDQLITAFAQTVISSDSTTSSDGETLNGTIVARGDILYVKLDGSDQLTPVISTTTGLKNGNKVKVLVKDHTATVTGNLSNPSAGEDEINDINDKILEIDTIVAEKATIEQLEAEKARIDEVIADTVTIKDRLTVTEADIKTLTADKATVDELNAVVARVDKVEAEMLTTEVAKITYATIADLDTTNANIHNLEADYAEFEETATNRLTALDANVADLEAKKLNAEDAKLIYAEIDFANIDTAAIQNFFSKSGMISDLVVGEGTVTGKLVGVTITGDLIEGNTIKADKLVIQGEDGLYYKLNVTGETVSSEQTEYNSLNGSVITAKSITAEKVSVTDLVAFGADIGGFHITEDSIYSNAKASVDNTTSGAYLGADGQFAIGDSSNFLKYYQDDDGIWRLSLSADQLQIVSSSGTTVNVDTAIADIDERIDDISVGGRNLILNTGFADGNDTLISWYQSNETEHEVEVVNDAYTRSGKACKVTFTEAGSSGPYIKNVEDNFNEKIWTERIKAGNSYILTAKMKRDDAGFVAMKHPGSNLIVAESVEAGTWTTLQLKIAPDTKVSVLTIEFFTRNASGGTVTNPAGTVIYIADIKLETGTLATDWTPAPEDMETTVSTIQGVAAESVTIVQGLRDEVSESLTDFSTSIDRNSVTVASLKETVTTYDQKISELEQFAEGWSFNFTEIQQQVTQLGDTVSTSTSETLKYIKFIGGEIWLGKDADEGEEDFKVVISNEKIRFLQNGDEVAYISNNQLYITNANVTTILRIGNFNFKPRSNGNLTFRLAS